MWNKNEKGASTLVGMWKYWGRKMPTYKGKKMKCTDRCPGAILAILIALTGTTVSAQTVINKCDPTKSPAMGGSLITVPGNYALNKPLTAGGTDCIKITTSNVSLKLNNQTITGPHPAFNPSDTIGISGIHVEAVFNSPCTNTLRACHVGIEGPGIIQGFSTGIYIKGADSSQVDYLTLRQNLAGLVAYDVTFLTAASNVIGSNAGDGLTMDGSRSSVVAQNDVSGNGRYGIYLDCGSVDGCPKVLGVPLRPAKDNTVNNNTANGNGSDGIRIATDPVSARVYGNVTNGNGSYGIEVGVSGGSQIFSNTALANASGDLKDGDPTPCTINFWGGNVFFNKDPSCIQ